jgi:hypothetical protein
MPQGPPKNLRELRDLPGEDVPMLASSGVPRWAQRRAHSMREREAAPVEFVPTPLELVSRFAASVYEEQFDLSAGAQFRPEHQVSVMDWRRAVGMTAGSVCVQFNG